MKRIASVLCFLALGANVYAGEQDGEHSRNYNYSVYQSYRYLSGASTDKIQETQQQARMFLPGWNATPDKLTGQFRDMYGPAAAVAGSNNLEKTTGLMSGKLVELGVQADEWQVTRNVTLSHASFVDYKRIINGHEVVFSNLSFRFMPDGRLLRIKMKAYSTPAQDVQPVLDADAAMSGNAATEGMADVTVDSRKVEGDWVWFPIPAADGYTMHPAWKVSLKGIGAEEMPFDVIAYVDAVDGKLLYRSNAVNETFEVTPKANIHMASPTSGTTEVPMRDMRVTIGGNNYVTDENGFVSIAPENAPLTAKYVVRGPWSRVDLNGSTPEFSIQSNASPATVILPVQDTASPEFRAVSAFFYVNNIHDYMKGHWPTFTGMDKVLTTNVDISGNTCNAFYNNGGFSINFYRPQASCRAFSVVSDIVYHEYGHGISYRFYSDNGSFFSNGALGEGNSDVWAMCINRDAVVGDGSFWNGGNIRSYGGSPKVYPRDIKGEVHADGEIIAGAWWDVATFTGSVDTMAKLFALTYNDLPNGPNGLEGEVYHDILISALLNDDDDGNIANGSPHFVNIVEAFARHGIYLMADAVVEHKEIPHQQPGVPANVSANLTLSNPAFFDKLYLVYRDRYGAGTWDSVVMNNTTGNTYTAQIPAYGPTSIIDYFFSAQDVIMASGYGLPKGFSPTGTSSELTLPYQYGVGLNVPRYTYDFEGSIDGWELGIASDAATGGKWVRDVPVGTVQNGLYVQTPADHTTGTGKCLITGNSSNSVSGDDVDDGMTTAVTPFFNLPFYEPVVEYYRWYSNDRGSNSNLRNDYWRVQIRSSNSQLWRSVDYTRESDQSWRRRVFRVSEYTNPQDPIQMRFIAEDRVVSTATQNGQNVIEAAVDDFVIYEGAPAGITNTKAITAEIFPNPADNAINITVPVSSRGKLTLYDITGKIISQQNLSENLVSYKFNTADLAPGTYLVLVETQFAIQNTKVVVSHK